MRASEKPLWKRWQEMTREEREADWADARARLEAGEISGAEAMERAEALRLYAEQEQREADQLKALDRLIRAVGCPPDIKPVPWLVKRGFLIEKLDCYVFTSKAMNLRGMNLKGLVTISKGPYPIKPRDHGGDGPRAA